MHANAKIITTLYTQNKKQFRTTAYYILKKFYSIPIDENDLISECLHQLIKKVENFQPINEITLEKYLLSNIKFVMFSYCRSFTRKNSMILNNYVDFELVENYHSNTYKFSEEITLDFLTKLQYEIFHDLYIDNLTIKEVAIKKTTTSHLIKNEIIKIKENIQKQIDNFVD